MAEKKIIKVGRPTDYKPEYAQIALQMMWEGAAKVELCRAFMVSRDTISEWENTIPEFSAAVRAASDYSHGFWTKMGQDNVGNKDFNTRLYEIQMMNRFGWSRKNESKNDVTVKQEDCIDNLK